MEDFYKGKSILITGGAGFVGEVLIERLLQFDPEVVRVLDTHENGLFELRQKYAEGVPGKIRLLLGDVRDLHRLQYACDGIDIVFHAASYKHVEECEYNPIDAVATNINGTSNVIQAAIANNVQKVIFTSSDKAVNPANTMGATKLLAEKLIIAANGYRGTHPTVFACCRFGNVVNSSGSVVPLFEKQIVEGKTITLTDPDMTRFVISKERAVELVLRSCMLAKGGEVFILKMPVIRIDDLANAMLKKRGRGSKVTVGRKAGEKMYEELMTEDEMTRAYENDELYVVFSHFVDSDPNGYTGFRKVQAVHSSRDVRPLTRQEILRLIE